MSHLFDMDEAKAASLEVSKRGNLKLSELGLRRCSRCLEWKPYGHKNPQQNDFARDATRSDGWRWDCKGCFVEKHGHKSDNFAARMREQKMKHLIYGAYKYFVYSIRVWCEGEWFVYIGHTRQQPLSRLFNHLYDHDFCSKALREKLVLNAKRFTQHVPAGQVLFNYRGIDATTVDEARAEEQAEIEKWRTLGQELGFQLLNKINAVSDSSTP